MSVIPNATASDESRRRSEIAALREMADDLRESAIRWRTLYEAAAGRCAELEAQLRQLGRRSRALPVNAAEQSSDPRVSARG
jgi:hypothetical protein